MYIRIFSSDVFFLFYLVFFLFFFPLFVSLSLIGWAALRCFAFCLHHAAAPTGGGFPAHVLDTHARTLVHMPTHAHQPSPRLTTGINHPFPLVLVLLLLLLSSFGHPSPDVGGDSRNYPIMAQGGHHRTQSGGGLPSSLTGVNAGYLGMGGMGGMGGIHAAQAAYGMATPRLMQASTSVRADGCTYKYVCTLCASFLSLSLSLYIVCPVLRAYCVGFSPKFSRCVH